MTEDLAIQIFGVPDQNILEQNNVITTSCLVCKKELKVPKGRFRDGHGKYCSKKCQHAADKNGEFVPCQMCHSLMYVTPATKNFKKYCSKACNSKSKERKILIPCIGCHKIFQKRQAAKQKYCSRRCAADHFVSPDRSYARTGKVVSCLECRKPFYVIKSALTTRKYCSTKCSLPHTQIQKQDKCNRFKKGHVGWNKGKRGYHITLSEEARRSRKISGAWERTPEFRKKLSEIQLKRLKDYQRITPIHNLIRKSTNYKTWRNLVFERDDYTCQMCGERGGTLRADHIKPFAFFPELRFDVANGRTLCDSCHRKTETYGRRAYEFDTRNCFI